MKRPLPIRLGLGTALLALLTLAVVPSAIAGVLIPGVESTQIDPGLKAQVLIEELNCVACHPGDPSLAARSKKAPRLAQVGSRVHPAYLEAFIRNPHGTKPGTTMPDVLGPLVEAERRQTAEAITHFLLSLNENEFSPEPPDSVAARHGYRLFHSRGCAACHSPRDEGGNELPAKASAPLGALDQKYSFKSLVDFLIDPHASRPSGRMPDMRLSRLDVEQIAHFLLQHTRVPGSLSFTLYRGKVWEGLDSDEVTAERAGHAKDFAPASLGKLHGHAAIVYDGWLNIAHAGRHTFFLKMNGGSLLVDDAPIIQQDPSDRRGSKELHASVELAAGWRKLQLTCFLTGHDPEFSCEWIGPQFDRQSIPSSMLSVSSEPIPAFKPPRIDPGLASRGREAFGRLGCANCHDDVGVSRAAGREMAALVPGRGCLSGTTGPWPQYDLDADQRQLIATALPQVEYPRLEDSQRIDKTLATFNCTACHERTGVGGIAPERKGLFTGSQPALGDQSRLPPPLSNVGAKLTREWLAEVLLHGKRQRDYVDASMPQFGEANVGHLVELFGRVDQLEAATIPKVANLLESKHAGYEMVGSTGLSCITCHEFNGQKSGEVSALDLAPVTRRLQKNWFHLYMRQPSRFHPTVIMPGYWPDGRSIRPNILEGDAGQQIEALWAYLDDGSRMKKPAGLSRQTNELRVGDVTEICRGQSPVGYRGIGVGYPERLNLAFDAGELALRQLWKGDFASVDSGGFRPLGSDQLSFPPGIPFHRLKSLEDAWPYKGKTNHTFPQDLGYRFRGYHLDAARKPTLLYNYGEIAVSDFFEDVRGTDGTAFFKRTLSFETPSDQQPFYFRAAAGNDIRDETKRQCSIDNLRVRITSNHELLVRQGSPGEVLIPLSLRKGSSLLTLEYLW